MKDRNQRKKATAFHQTDGLVRTSSSVSLTARQFGGTRRISRPLARRSGLALAAALVSIAIGTSAGAFDSIAIQKSISVMSAVAEPPAYPEEPEYRVFLYVNNVPVDCSATCSYSENHVFDIYTEETIGYRDTEDPLLIVDENDAPIGFLAE